MLRALVAVLIAANLGFAAWAMGWLDGVVGVRANGDREPERLTRQVRPETITILAPSAAVPASAPAGPAPLACLEAGPFDAAQLAAAEAAVQAVVPRGQWSVTQTEQAGSWIVYMGKFANREAQTKKEDELKRLKFGYEEIELPPELGPGLSLGLSLGQFTERSLADKALAEFTARGVRTARVVELAAPKTTQSFRVARADAALAERLGGLKVDALGKGFAPCASAEVATR